MAYIDLPNVGSAESAIAMFNGFEVDGKPLTVTLAEERPLKRPRPRPVQR
jgi:hypothetical protein